MWTKIYDWLMIHWGIPVFQWLTGFEVRRYNKQHDENIEYYISYDKGVKIVLNDIEENNYSSDWVWQNNWRRLGRFIQYMGWKYEDLTITGKLEIHFGTTMIDDAYLHRMEQLAEDTGGTIRTIEK